MKLQVKDMDISSGGALIAVINRKDAKKMDLHKRDRVKIIKGNKIETVLLNIGESERAVGKGKIGLYEEVLDSLNLKGGDSVLWEKARFQENLLLLIILRKN